MGEKVFGHRKFYDLPDSQTCLTESNCDISDTLNLQHQKSSLLAFIDQNVIGREKTFSGPYGLRKAVYCDYTASGRSLKFIEDYIQEQVLPDYGNTHTTTSVTSLQTTLFRHESRDIVRNAVNAGEHDVVIFTGSGCTAAVHKLIHAMNLTQPPVVFVGPYEHHSNLLPWRELGSEVITVQETPEGLVDIKHLERELEHWSKQGCQLIGCFSAASNITGHLVDTEIITECLHRYGALAFWDYATAGPYVNIDMNPISSSGVPTLAAKDALFLSPHKFVGGVQTPGILVAKKKLFKNPVPSGGGGGSVFFVSREGHRYLQEVELREEGGTPAIVESIRAGLVFQLKEAVGTSTIMEQEHQLCKKAMAEWGQCADLVLLGSTTVPRLPIFSFMVRHRASGRFLHHNFICAVLNDVFGIQARGGCACAGPYAQELLGIDENLAVKYENALLEDSRLDRVHLRRYAEYSDREILRPGFVRLNLPYFMEPSAVDFVIQAVKLVAEYAWKLLPLYKFNPETGEWRHSSHQVFKDRKWLGHVTYRSGHMTVQQPSFSIKGPLPTSFEDCLQQGKAVMESPKNARVQLGEQSSMFSADTETLRWFLLPSEALSWMNGSAGTVGNSAWQPPFVPKSYGTACGGEGHSSKKICTDSSATSTELPKSERQEEAKQEEFSEGMKNALQKGFSTECSTESQLESSTDTQHSISDRGDTKTYGVTNTLAGLAPVATTGKATRVSYGVIPPGLESTSVITSGSDTNLKQKQSDVKAKDLPESKRTNVCVDGACFTKRRKTEVASEEKREESKATETKKSQWHAPPKMIFKPTMQAIQEHNMLQDGDRLLVCLSGGKDSLSLLHTLRQYQFYAKSKGVQFEMGAVTVDPQTSAYDPSPLKPYLAALGVPYFYEEQCILDTASSLPDVASICSFCSRMKRGRIYAAARREGYNVLALGQHLDDLAESFLMSVFHNGILRTMKASYTVEEGDLRVIRPFIFVREKDLRQFAESKQLPVIPENCPACFEAPKERHRIKQLLAAQEILHPRLFPSLQAAIHPLMSINQTGVSARTILQGDWLKWVTPKKVEHDTEQPEEEDF